MLAVTCQEYERPIFWEKGEERTSWGLPAQVGDWLQKHGMGRHLRPHLDRMGGGRSGDLRGGVCVCVGVGVWWWIWGRGGEKGLLSNNVQTTTSINLRLHAYITLPWHWETTLTPSPLNSLIYLELHTTQFLSHLHSSWGPGHTHSTNSDIFITKNQMKGAPFLWQCVKLRD